MVEMMVVVWLTFMDGSIVQYKNDAGEVPVVSAETAQDVFKKCKQEFDRIHVEMREDFKDHDPKPSTFMDVCTQKE